MACSTALASTRIQDIVADRTADNYALIISVAAGLPGLANDREKVRGILERKEFGFHIYELRDKDATKPVLESTLMYLSKKAGDRGTLVVYFGGHGAEGQFYLGDKKFFSANDFKKSIAGGRKGKSALERLMIFVDACESGSFVDPWSASQKFIGSFGAWTPKDGARNLFLFASSLPHESSLAAAEGSYFTLALRQAFDEAVAQELSLGEWARLTQQHTQEHHPVFKFVPEAFSEEKVLNSPCD